MSLRHVTFTGWDRNTDRDALSVFCSAWPAGQVEIAVLQSSSRVGEERYPCQEEAAALLLTADGAGQRTAVHLCGAYARGLIDDELAAVLADEDGGNPDANYWIDMESGIRESMAAWPGGPRQQADKPVPTFVSIRKCMAVMMACAPFLR